MIFSTEFDGDGSRSTAGQGNSGDDKQLQHRQVLQRRRTRTIYVKLLANVLFLLVWWRSFVTVNHILGRPWKTLLGSGFWGDFSAYAVLSACPPVFSLIGLFREGAIVSHLWFEIFWLLIVSVFDSCLIWRQAKFWPPLKFYAGFDLNDPYLTTGTVSYVLTVILLPVDLGLSLFWSGFLGITAWKNRKIYPTIWVLGAQDFPWLVPTRPLDPFPSLFRLIVGAPRQPLHSIPGNLKRWLLSSTMFRRFGSIEPIAHCIARGVLATVLWAALIAYAILNCLINPVRQFTQPEGLPTRFLLRDSVNVATYGHVNGFIALGFVDPSQLPKRTNYSLPYSPEMCDAITGGIRASVMDPQTQKRLDCKAFCGKSWARSSNGHQLVQIEALWDCGAIWDNLRFPASAPIPNTRPYVSVSWNSSAYPTSPVISAGLGSIYINNLNDFRGMTNGLLSTPREWKNGVTFNFTAGQDLQVEVARRRYYSNRATFWDLLGILQSPNIFITYPILSRTENSAALAPHITRLTFHPVFSPYHDELYEEYLDYTVISGISATGGIYATFDIVFVLLFGRSLVAAFCGGKQVTPFGALALILKRDSFRQNLLKEYPGIDGEEGPNERAHATCKFLHDFVLDLAPLEISPTKRRRESNQMSTNLGITDDARDIPIEQQVPIPHS